MAEAEEPTELTAFVAGWRERFSNETDKIDMSITRFENEILEVEDLLNEAENLAVTQIQLEKGKDLK